MQKLFKLTGVSVLAIVATTNADAAGYTCEELVEYTSCNPGYYLGYESVVAGKGCPDNYTMDSDGICFDDYNSWILGTSMTKEECYSYTYEKDGIETLWISGPVCVNENDNEYHYDFVDIETGGNTCVSCPVGYTCAGEKNTPVSCPAGSYCATAGLATPTGKCNVGTYSMGGATSADCTSCPVSGLTDANGNAVSVTTASTGSTSSSECFVAQGTVFKDDKGFYKYTGNCEYGNFNERAECEADPYGTWNEDGNYCDCGGDTQFWVYSTTYGVAYCSSEDDIGLMAGCEDTGGTWSWSSGCSCPEGTDWNQWSDDYGECL